MFTSGNDTVKFHVTFLVKFNYSCYLKIPLPCFTKFVFPLLERVSVLVITKVLVRMHKIHVKKDPSKP